MARLTFTFTVSGETHQEIWTSFRWRLRLIGDWRPEDVTMEFYEGHANFTVKMPASRTRRAGL